MKADRASATARLIARSTIFTSQNALRKRFVPAQSAELCALFVEAHSVTGKRVNAALQNSSTVRALVELAERLLLPGIQLHYALRKRFIEEQTRAAISCGIRQIIVLGAGFDTLALRLHKEFPAVRFIEADHPATQQAKLRMLETCHTPDSNLSFLSIDLAEQSLSQQLLSHKSYEPREDALFIAEGLLMYLERSDVIELFSFIRDYSSARSKFAFSFMDNDDDPERIRFRNSSRAVEAWLRLRGEDFKWSIGLNYLPQFLAAFSFNAREIATCETFRHKYLAPENLSHLRLADGEHICLAERA